MDLMCTARNWISLICMSFHLMCMVGGLVFSSAPDRWGYRRAIKVFGSVNLLAQIAALVIPNYYVRLICYAVMGLCYTKFLVPYAWVSGFVMDKHLPLVNGAMTGYDQLVVIVLISYLITVSRNWFGIFAIQTFIGAVALLIVLMFIPESPK